MLYASLVVIGRRTGPARWCQRLSRCRPVTADGVLELGEAGCDVLAAMVIYPGAQEGRQRRGEGAGCLG
jgi:hypothetical protein